MTWTQIYVLACAGAALASGCGASKQSAETRPAPAEEGEDGSEAEADKALLTAACEALVTVGKRDTCAFVQDPERWDVASCVADNRGALSRASEADRAAMTEMLRCMGAAATCDAIALCMTPSREVTVNTFQEQRMCGQPGGGTVRLGPDEAAARYGKGAVKLSQVASSKERPVEVCGFRAQLEWLRRVTCEDGTSPFASLKEAYDARVGSAGMAGRCMSIIDHYQVPCPEKLYDVYLDAYMCGPGETFSIELPGS